MTSPPRTSFSHVGFHVHDLDAMVAFYTELLGLEVTDRGTLNIPGRPRIAFLSSDPSEHHQIALVEGREDGGIRGGILNQVSFRVDGLEDLRRMKAAAEALGVDRFLPMTHGNAWSLYFEDPEGNAVEVFTGSPFHVRQPVTEGLDLTHSDDEIVAETRRRFENEPDFGTAEDWSAAFAERIEKRRGTR
jgi:catechol 2,3-dioxygenase